MDSKEILPAKGTGLMVIRITAIRHIECVVLMSRVENGVSASDFPCDRAG